MLQNEYDANVKFTFLKCSRCLLNKDKIAVSLQMLIFLQK